jgi:hypothetical protein
MLGCALTLAAVRPELVANFQRVEQGTDVLSLGYRAALADLLYAHVLVQSGIHVQEKRRYEYVGEYIDVINALDPKFRSPYRFADTLLVLQSVPAREREYRKAREILLRGIQAFPHDQELWNNAGQYLAYLAAPHLKDRKEQEQWRLEGARILARACELVSGTGALPHTCITAAGLLSKAGERDATAAFLERFLAVNEDAELREFAINYLAKLKGEEQRELAKRRGERLREVWQRDLSFVSREQLLLVGPPFDAAACAGQRERRAGCVTSWRDFWRDEDQLEM